LSPGVEKDRLPELVNGDSEIKLTPPVAGLYQLPLAFSESLVVKEKDNEDRARVLFIVISGWA
jgi:hypothetical protein